MATVTATINATQLENVQKLVKILHEITTDEQIPLSIREEYMDKVNKVLED